MDDELNRVTDLIRRHGEIAEIGPDQDIYESGVSSAAALMLVMELETAFEVSIPDTDFIAARTPRALYDLVTRLRQEQRA
jgi:acyl carrier protein